MRNLFLCILLFLVLLSSCSSSAKATWYIKDVAKNKRVWRYCSLDLDGPERSGRGFCYISQRCIDKVFRKEKCEPVPMFCAYGNNECLRINGYPEIKRGM